MNIDEYAIMRRVEDQHWWYVALRDIVRMFWDTYAPKQGQPVRLLDAGCGTGANLAMLSGKGTAFGVDFAPEAVRLCRERGLARTAVASIDALPFSEESFDLVLSCDVICNRSIPDKRLAVNELARVLRPGGVLFLNLPAYQWLWSSHDAAVHTDRRFTRTQINRLLRNAGLAPRRLTHWNATLFPPIALTRLWRRRSDRRTSDLDNASGERFSTFFQRILTLEQRLLRRTTLPFGTSIFAIATKKTPSPKNATP